MYSTLLMGTIAFVVVTGNTPSVLFVVSRYFTFGSAVCVSNGIYNIQIFSRVHATLQPTLSVGRLVSWSVGRSVGHILLFFIIIFFAPAKMVW